MLRYSPQSVKRSCLHCANPLAALGATYFLPDSMNLSYSTAILQDSAWRLWAAEQLVLMTFPVGRDRVKAQHQSILHFLMHSNSDASPHTSQARRG